MAWSVGMSEVLRRIVSAYGEVPLIERRVRVSAKTLRTLEGSGGDIIGAAGLVWNESGQVLLVRHLPGTDWGARWVTPGGAARPGESPEDTFLREVREETGLKARVLDLSCVFDLKVTDGVHEVRGYFFQFVALAARGSPAPGPGIAEVRWFDELPREMAFREDYVEAFQRGVGSRQARDD
jgi:ADP-ribose pyrophosphatase YjhB (NUDIX family)